MNLANNNHGSSVAVAEVDDRIVRRRPEKLDPKRGVAVSQGLKCGDR